MMVTEEKLIKRKKGRRVLKRRPKKDKTDCVDEMTSLVRDMTVQSQEHQLHIPEVNVIETQSQPQSRRGSSTNQSEDLEFLQNPGYFPRRSSETHIHEENISEHLRKKETYTRKGSIKRGSLMLDDEEVSEVKRLKAEMEAKEMMKKAQKEFTWDTVKPIKGPVDTKQKRYCSIE